MGGVLILDDLMCEGSDDHRVLDLFTRESRHRGITIVFMTQDMFPKGKHAKTISRNAHYIVAFKNPRDQLGVRILMQQAFPYDFKEVFIIRSRKVKNQSIEKRRVHDRVSKKNRLSEQTGGGGRRKDQRI